MANADSCRQAVQATLDAFGTVSILVNNVGVTGPPGKAIEVDPEAFDRAMRINVTSMMLMAKYALPPMVEAGGGVDHQHVVGVGVARRPPEPALSDLEVGGDRAYAGDGGSPRRAGYAGECIAPGTVYTPMVASRGMTPELRRARWEGTLLKMEGTAWDVAAGVVFLASDAARWITGVVLPIDAGATAARLQSLSPRSDGGASK